MTYKCYRCVSPMFDLVQADRVPEKAWLVVPDRIDIRAYWVRHDGSKIRDWSGDCLRPYDLCDDSYWKIVHGPGCDDIIDPDLKVDERL